MPDNVTFSAGTLYGFLLVMARVGGALTFVPLPGVKSAPEPARIALALGFTLALYSQWPVVRTDAITVAALAGYAASGNRGLLVGAGTLVTAAAYHAVTAWPLTIDQTEGLVLATRAVGFPVGHASAQLTWRGLRSRPTWRILLYSADTPPSMRGLVELDAVDGTVLGEYTETNPEDWSVYTAS